MREDEYVALYAVVLDQFTVGAGKRARHTCRPPRTTLAIECLLAPFSCGRARNARKCPASPFSGFVIFQRCHIEQLVAPFAAVYNIPLLARSTLRPVSYPYR